MSADRFKGHTRGTMFVRQNGNDSSGYYVQWHGMVVAQRMTEANAELFKAAPEVLAENERLKHELAAALFDNERLLGEVKLHEQLSAGSRDAIESAFNERAYSDAVAESLVDNS